MSEEKNFVMFVSPKNVKKVEINGNKMYEIDLNMPLERFVRMVLLKSTEEDKIGVYLNEEWNDA